VQSLVTRDDPDIASKKIVRRLLAGAWAFGSVIGPDLRRMVAPRGESPFSIGWGMTIGEREV
jgi:hypothetical protein